MPVETLERPAVEPEEVLAPEEVLDPDGHVFHPFDDFMAKRRFDNMYAHLGEIYDR